jgi:hypothetical protein
MVPQHTGSPGGPPRSLAPNVEKELEDTFRAIAAGQDVKLRLQRAIEAAARDARERQLRAEELLLAFKAIEERSGVLVSGGLFVGGTGYPVGRSQLIRTLIEAYYGFGS